MSSSRGGDDTSRVALVADGDKAVRLLSRVILESAGWRVVEAASGDDAIQRAIADRPRVAVLDAGADGFEVAAALAADPATKDTAVVFVSASGDASTRAAKLNAPFLLKPFNPALLISTVEQATRRPAS